MTGQPSCSLLRRAGLESCTDSGRAGWNFGLKFKYAPFNRLPTAALFRSHWSSMASLSTPGSALAGTPPGDPPSLQLVLRRCHCYRSRSPITLTKRALTRHERQADIFFGESDDHRRAHLTNSHFGGSRVIRNTRGRGRCLHGGELSSVGLPRAAWPELVHQVAEHRPALQHGLQRPGVHRGA